MLRMPPGAEPFINVVGLDPGSTTFGVAVIRFNIETFQIDRSTAWTINVPRLVRKNDWVSSIHGDRFGRILELGYELLRIFQDFEAFSIVTESPFFNRARPQAGVVLFEVLATIRHAVLAYDKWKELEEIPPSNVKNAVGASGGGGKDAVRNRVLALAGQLRYEGNVPIDMLDEHSIDALAVAFSRIKIFMG